MAVCPNPCPRVKRLLRTVNGMERGSGVCCEEELTSPGQVHDLESSVTRRHIGVALVKGQVSAKALARNHGGHESNIRERCREAERNSAWSPHVEQGQPGVARERLERQDREHVGGCVVAQVDFRFGDNAPEQGTDKLRVSFRSLFRALRSPSMPSSLTVGIVQKLGAHDRGVGDRQDRARLGREIPDGLRIDRLTFGSSGRGLSLRVTSPYGESVWAFDSRRAATAALARPLIRPFGRSGGRNSGRIADEPTAPAPKVVGRSGMTTLDQIQPNAALRGILPDCAVTVVNVQWFGSEALELTYKDPSGKVANVLLYKHDEHRRDLVEAGRPWSFDGDGELFRLVSEAHRIRLAHLFDPVLAVHTSLLDPLPHQITAVYEAMLPRQPLRFLLADDPGAGKTIMAGLFIKELIARGDLQRCLIVCPGSLAEQWQDELLPTLPASLRHSHQRQARGRSDRQLVPREQPHHRTPRQAVSQRGRAREARGRRLRLGPCGLRRGAQALRDLLRW